jgi:hypothetical protein
MSQISVLVQVISGGRSTAFRGAGCRFEAEFPTLCGGHQIAPGHVLPALAHGVSRHRLQLLANPYRPIHKAGRRLTYFPVLLIIELR